MLRTDEKPTNRTLLSLWCYWTAVMASFIAVYVLSFFVSKAWLPMPVATLSYVLLVASRRNAYGPSPRCVLILRFGMLVLLISAIIMETINLLNSKLLLDGLINWSNSNQDIPYVTTLVLMPVMTIVAAAELMLSHKIGFCRDCRARNGNVPGSSVITAIYKRESRYQLLFILAVSAAIGAVQWWYYWVYYINVNFNSPDLFFFRVMPMVILGMLIVFMLMRYTNMSIMIGPMLKADDSRNSLVRFLVTAGDYVLLQEMAEGRWDTPATAEVNPRDLADADKVEQLWNSIAGIKDTQLRQLYVNKNYDLTTDIIHYAAFTGGDSGDAPTGRLKGRWMTIETVDQLLKQSKLNAELANEIYRIFTITMAWKTYTPEGKRRYPIRGYRPAFVLRDFKTWDVDYDDLNWFEVANNNEDRPFFRTRRLWQRLTGRPKK